jgi:cell division initiation protein
MMTPSQLKEYEFKTAGRNAYKADDVDDFFAEVAANYTKMFHENGELVRRVGLLADRLEKFKKEEEEIKSAVVSAQRAADIIVRDARNSVADAESEAEAVLAAAKSEAELIKSDAEKQAIADSELLLSMTRDKAQEIIKKAKEEAGEILLKANSTAKDAMGAATRTMTSESLHFEMLKKEVAEFKSSILNQYKSHIELITRLPDLAEEEAKKIEGDKPTVNEEKNQAIEEAINEINETGETEESFIENTVEDEVKELVSEKEQLKVAQSTSSDEPNAFEEQKNQIAFVQEEQEEAPLFVVNSDVEAEVSDLVEEKIEINVDSENDFSAKELEEAENSIEDFEADERKAAVQYFSNEANEDLIEVDEDMLTQDGELVVKTDLPLSMFDDTDSLEFVDDFAGMEKQDEDDYGSFMFTDAIVNDAAQKRPSRRATVDSSYLDFLASEADAEYNRNSQPIIEDDEDEAPVKRGFFRRK